MNLRLASAPSKFTGRGYFDITVDGSSGFQAAGGTLSFGFSDLYCSSAYGSVAQGVFSIEVTSAGVPLVGVYSIFLFETLLTVF